MVLPVTGLVENGTAMVPVAAVAQALGYQVIYTPGEDGEGDRIAVESDQFSVQMTVGEDQIIGVTKIKVIDLLPALVLVPFVTMAFGALGIG